MAEQQTERIKKPETYEALRDKGYSKEKSARIANAQQNDHQQPSKKGGESEKYEKRTKSELYQLAKDVDIDGRSKMNKAELIAALRDR